MCQKWLNPVGQGQLARYVKYLLMSFFQIYLSYLTFFLERLYIPNPWTDLHARWLKRRDLAQSAFWGSLFCQASFKG